MIMIYKGCQLVRDAVRVIFRAVRALRLKARKDKVGMVLFFFFQNKTNKVRMVIRV